MDSPSAYFNCISPLSPSEVAGSGAALPFGNGSDRAGAPGCDGGPGNHEQPYEDLQGGGFQKSLTPKGDQRRHPRCAEEEGERRKGIRR